MGKNRIRQQVVRIKGQTDNEEITSATGKRAIEQTINRANDQSSEASTGTHIDTNPHTLYRPSTHTHAKAQHPKQRHPPQRENLTITSLSSHYLATYSELLQTNHSSIQATIFPFILSNPIDPSIDHTLQSQYIHPFNTTFDLSHERETWLSSNNNILRCLLMIQISFLRSMIAFYRISYGDSVFSST